MTGTETLKKGFNGARMVTRMLLADLSDADLLVRPVEGANSIAWQLGHLIASEHVIGESVLPGSMPKLPDGFQESYSKETAKGDLVKPLSKDEYLRLLEEQRAGTLKLLDKIGDAALDEPGPEGFRKMFPTKADVLCLMINHEVMHAGQYTVVRRKLGKPNVI
jgi:uncharacterized damage-inducible protein DinB